MINPPPLKNTHSNSSSKFCRLKKDSPPGWILVYKISTTSKIPSEIDSARNSHTLKLSYFAYFSLFFIQLFFSLSFPSPTSFFSLNVILHACRREKEGERKSYFAVVKKLKESEEKRAFTNTQNAIF